MEAYITRNGDRRIGIVRLQSPAISIRRLSVPGHGPHQGRRLLRSNSCDEADRFFDRDRSRRGARTEGEAPKAMRVSPFADGPSSTYFSPATGNRNQSIVPGMGVESPKRPHPGWAGRLTAGSTESIAPDSPALGIAPATANR